MVKQKGAATVQEIEVAVRHDLNFVRCEPELESSINSDRQGC